MDINILNGPQGHYDWKKCQSQRGNMLYDSIYVTFSNDNTAEIENRLEATKD